MKLLLAVLSAIVLHVQSNEIDLGPYDDYIEIGDVPQKYFPPTDVDYMASANARVFTELLRREFPYGLSTNMPPLDPYKRPRMPIIEIPVSDEILINGTLALSNLVRTGAQDFVLHKLEMRFTNDTRTDFVVSVPEIHANVDFDAHIQISDIVIHQEGHASVQITGATYSGAVGAKSILPIGSLFPRFFVYGLHLNVHADDVKIDLSPLVPNGRRSDIVPDLVKTLETHVAKSVTQMAMDQTNEVLRNYSTNQVLALLEVI